MSDPADLKCHSLQFYATASYPCSYLPGREARSQVAAPMHLITSEMYSRLVEQGFRRSGLFTYRPHCDNCHACKPIRLDIGAFLPNRSQKRVWKHHQTLIARTQPLAFNPEHFALYQRYIQARHHDSGLDDDSEAQYNQFLLTSRVSSSLVEFREPITRQLMMVSIIDILDNGLSAVYTFFEPEAQGSLGTYGILWQIERCRELQLPWLYLGYWISESRKMAYKSNFHPHQIYINGRWVNPHQII
jgi:arginine-tRNA-protein transferase